MRPLVLPFSALVGRDKRSSRQTVGTLDLNSRQPSFQRHHFPLEFLQRLSSLREFLNLCILLVGGTGERLNLRLLLLDGVQHRPQNRIVVHQ